MKNYFSWVLLITALSSLANCGTIQSYGRQREADRKAGIESRRVLEQVQREKEQAQKQAEKEGEIARLALMQKIADCKKPELTRNNALQQRDCEDGATIDLAKLARYSRMATVHQIAAAKRDYAVQYNEGKISKEAYLTKINLIEADAIKEEQTIAEQQQAIREQLWLQAIRNDILEQSVEAQKQTAESQRQQVQQLEKLGTQQNNLTTRCGIELGQYVCRNTPY